MMPRRDVDILPLEGNDLRMWEKKNDRYADQLIAQSEMWINSESAPVRPLDQSEAEKSRVTWPLARAVRRNG